MKRGTVYAALLCVALLPAAAAGRDAQLERLRQGVWAKLDELRRDTAYPGGATAGFVLPDGRSASASVGTADIENNVPMRPGDRMLAGSIGKTYFAALALAEEGRLNLDDKISRWLGGEPWFSRLPNAPDITLRMLMNHTSGVPEHVLHRDFNRALRDNPDRVWKWEGLIAYVLDARPLFPAGQGWSYADTNYILVGLIIERVMKKPAYDEIARRILKPLQLADTLPSDRRVIPGLITGYSRADSPFGFAGRVIVEGRFVINPQFEWAGGGFASTPADLARWARALYEGRAFGKPWLDQMLTGVEARQGRGAGAKYGLGVQIRQTEWGTSYGHEGWFPGYLSAMEYFPELKVAVAVQVNTDDFRQLRRGPHAYLLEAARVIAAEMGLKKAA